MSEHRPEPFTTIDNLCAHGFQCDMDDDGWVVVAQTQRSIVEALRFLDSKGCTRVGLLLNVIPEHKPYDYVPVCCETDPRSLIRAIEKLDFNRLTRKPTLYFKLETPTGTPSAFVGY